MQNQPYQLLERLEALAHAVRDTGQGLALIGLGSVGVERDRLDSYSDLDFYVVARPGAKTRFIEQLDWLEAASPVGYGFQNSTAGWKILYQDGIFIEYAIFEPDDMAHVHFSEGRLVWHDPDFDLALANPNLPLHENRLENNPEWKLGEILTNLYIGLLRYHRGEKLSAARFIQGYAVDRILELAPYLEATQPAHADPFQPERRFERRFPEIAACLPDFVPGYANSPQAAQAILAYIDQHFDVAPFIKSAILKLC
jgi:lincosamide nucleotidyltransferase B/F